MKVLTPKPTVYDGIQMRSRLEAHWAEFLDKLGIYWLYEEEGYKLDNGVCYLPDFYLPDMNCYLEVKGIMNDVDMEKIEQLSIGTGKDVVIGYPDGKFDIVTAWNNEATLCGESYSWLVQCVVCKSNFFLDSCGSWACKSCGAYDGDAYISVKAYGDADNFMKWGIR